MVELISLHIPKCAGVAFREALINAYGKESVCADYNESPFNPISRACIDPEGHIKEYSEIKKEWLNYKVVHGHFYLPKYRTANALRITILRHPIERLLSHYFYWQTYPRHGHPLHDYFLDQHLTLLEFARLPFVRNFYSGVFLKNMDRKELDYVGRTEAMDESFAIIARLTGKPLQLAKHNQNTGENYSIMKKRGLEKNVHNTLKDLLRNDLAFYERWTL